MMTVHGNPQHHSIEAAVHAAVQGPECIVPPMREHRNQSAAVKLHCGCSARQ